MEYFPRTLYAGWIYYSNVEQVANDYINEIDSFVKANGKKAANEHKPTLAALGNLSKLKKHLENLEGWDIPRPKKFDFWVNISQ